jgi:glycosyltransferase involved in cell wall biosynthesis
MSKPDIHLIDMKFSLHGHYIDDLKEFSFLSKTYNCHYYAPVASFSGAVNVDDAMTFHPVNSGFFFYLYLYKLLLLKRKDVIFFLSCSYIPLFLLSLLSVNFNYIFRVHSLPTIKVRTYNKIIRWMSNLCIGTVFLDYPVKEYFVDKGYSCPNKSTCVLGRTLNIKSKTLSKSNSKFNLLFIGAMNAEKDLKPILDALCERKIDNLSMSFISKGIEKYDKELNRLKFVYEDTIVINTFLDRADYDDVISKADALILPYKTSYGVRFSAVLNDALSLGKKVLTIRLPQFEYYSKKYNSCYLYTDQHDVVEAIESLMASPSINIEKLNLDYSLEVKKDQVRRLGL